MTSIDFLSPIYLTFIYIYLPLFIFFFFGEDLIILSFFVFIVCLFFSCWSKQKKEKEIQYKP